MLWRGMAGIVVAVLAGYGRYFCDGLRGLCRDHRNRIGGDPHRLCSTVAVGAKLLLSCRAPGHDSSDMRRGTFRHQLPAHEVRELASAKGRRDRLRARFHRLLARLVDLL